MDIFLEDEYSLREKYRYREKNTDEQIQQNLEKKIQEKQTSLHLQREATKLACKYFRVHAVDVRPSSGLYFYLDKILPLIEDMSELQELMTYMFGSSLQYLFDFVLKLTKSSMSHCSSEICTILDTEIAVYQQNIINQEKYQI